MAGNRADNTNTGVLGVTDSVNGDTSYQANNLNEYTVVDSLNPSYDTNGNLQSQGGWTYTYDALNRLTQAHDVGPATTISCSYDGRNRCVTRTINNVTTFFYYDGWSLLEEHNGSDALLARYVQSPRVDDLVARIAGASTYYYHQDSLGSTVALTDVSHNVTERYTYDVFGAPTLRDGSGNVVSTSASGNRFLFTGREYTQQAALYDSRNRIYSPKLGRFFQTDPIRFGAGDTNLYRYVKNSPVNSTDPFGLVCGSDSIPWYKPGSDKEYP